MRHEMSSAANTSKPRELGQVSEALDRPAAGHVAEQGSVQRGRPVLRFMKPSATARRAPGRRRRAHSPDEGRLARAGGVAAGLDGKGGIVGARRQVEGREVPEHPLQPAAGLGDLPLHDGSPP
jgi:hypothetical protein